MAELKTKPNDQNVEEFLKKVENPRKRNDSFEILNLMREVTQEEPIIWGDSIVGFGSYHYKYASGREEDWFQIGFSPRKQSLTICIVPEIERFEDILNRLGKFRTGKSCLYINKLQDINLLTLKELMEKSVKYLRKHYIDT
ncbi:MAG: DUF1801 domain-containing protein [Promethearchaeota archaeon]